MFYDCFVLQAFHVVPFSNRCGLCVGCLAFQIPRSGSCIETSDLFVLCFGFCLAVSCLSLSRYRLKISDLPGRNTAVHKEKIQTICNVSVVV